MATRSGALFEPTGIFSKRVRYDYLYEMETWLKGARRRANIIVHEEALK